MTKAILIKELKQYRRMLYDLVVVLDDILPVNDREGENLGEDYNQTDSLLGTVERLISTLEKVPGKQLMRLNGKYAKNHWVVKRAKRKTPK